MKIPAIKPNGKTIVVMNLEPLVTAKAVTRVHTINKVPYKIVKRLFLVISSIVLPKLPISPSDNLNLRFSSIFLDAETLSALLGFPFDLVLGDVIFLSLKILEINTYNTYKPANKTAIPPIPFTTPLVLAKNIDCIPGPNKLGICISATEISTLGKPPTTVEADCNESNESNLPNIPVTPSTPWKIARPIKATTPIKIIDKNSF